MVQVPSVFHIDDVTEKIVKEKAAPTGETEIINYRDWKTIQFKSPVYKIPLEFCLFRTDNGRIMTEVLSYQTSKGSLTDYRDPKVQEIISKFLSEKDKDKNNELKLNLKKDGQTEPAIITADGEEINFEKGDVGTISALIAETLIAAGIAEKSTNQTMEEFR